ncbi:CheY-like superfamily [Chlamydoabsidia padenii]|nr:CheY-like superfamily [Chlamydoabsidia padenii]
MDFASDGYHALRLLEHHHYDAMLLDIDMPVMNGVETTEFIRRPTSCILSVNRSIPIIAVTTNDSSEARRLYQHVGMDACLSKPIKAGQLKSQLLELLNQSSSL